MWDKRHDDVMASKQKSKRFSELKKWKQLINRLLSTRSGYLEMYCTKKLREHLNNLMFESTGWWFFLVSTYCCHVIFYSTNYAEYGTKDFRQEYFIQQNQMFEFFVLFFNFVSIYWVLLAILPHFHVQETSLRGFELWDMFPCPAGGRHQKMGTLGSYREEWTWTATILNQAFMIYWCSVSTK